MPASAELQGLFDLRKRKNSLNNGPKLTFVDNLSNLSKPRAVGLDADHRSTHALFPREILPRLLGQRHQNSAFLEHFERSPLRIIAQWVKHHVHVMNMIFEACPLVVDCFIAAEFSDQVDMFGTRSGAEYSCTTRLRELHRHRTDSARSRVDEHRLPLLQVRHINQCLMCR